MALNQSSEWLYVSSSPASRARSAFSIRQPENWLELPVFDNVTATGRQTQSTALERTAAGCVIKEGAGLSRSAGPQPVRTNCHILQWMAGHLLWQRIR